MIRKAIAAITLTGALAFGGAVITDAPEPAEALSCQEAQAWAKKYLGLTGGSCINWAVRLQHRCTIGYDGRCMERRPL